MYKDIKAINEAYNQVMGTGNDRRRDYEKKLLDNVKVSVDRKLIDNPEEAIKMARRDIGRYLTEEEIVTILGWFYRPEDVENHKREYMESERAMRMR